MTHKAETPSRGAREITEKLHEMTDCHPLCGCMDVAALIDRELAELLPFLQHDPDCSSHCCEHGWRDKACLDKLPCNCDLAALLAKYTPGEK